jgi:hypothetical protein
MNYQTFDAILSDFENARYVDGIAVHEKGFTLKVCRNLLVVAM